MLVDDCSDAFKHIGGGGILDRDNYKRIRTNGNLVRSSGNIKLIITAFAPFIL